jgi:Na+/H+ antiporter NhaC
MDYGIISVLIPIFTIVLALITKDVIISLLSGIFASLLILNNYNFADAFIALFNGIIKLFQEGWITKTLIFSLLIGAIIELLSKSKAVDFFIAWLSKKASSIDSPKGAMLLAYFIGVIIFIESSITSLVSATVAKPLFDKHNISREKLAYISDSTSAPICSLIPLNAWGALLLGLIVTAIESKVISGDGVGLLIASIPYNFYSIFTLLIVLYVILFNKDFKIMQQTKANKFNLKVNNIQKATPFPMLLPIIIMVAAVPIGLYLTGDKNIFKGSGSTSVYYATIVTLIFTYIYYLGTKLLTHKEYFDSFFKGIGNMLPIMVILMLAIFIGQVIGELKTAKYISELLSGSISPIYMPTLIFIVAAITAFSTGTSWGTFSIMMPIALALSSTMELNTPLVIGAVISGGIFGDHSSPISDTTIISSMASECNHISHVRTQLPYALTGAVLAIIAYLVAGYLLH